MRPQRDPRTLASGDEIVDEATGERYRVLSLVGEGGMGRVFRVQHVRTGQLYAAKCNQPIDPNNKTLVERVRREGEFLKGLRRHAHIVPVLATGVTPHGVCWMLMPLLDGASVGGLLSVLGRIPLVWAMEICRAVCSALSAVHSVAIHRDIKPDNLFVTREGGIYLLDWGAGKFYTVGRLTTTGTTLGTIPYSSPEQLRDPDHLDGRSDLFSVGLVAFHMLSGQHPFEREGEARPDVITLGYRIIHEEPRSLAALAPELPSYVPAIVERLLTKDRNNRSRSAEEAARVFVACLTELRSRLGALLPIERIFDVYDAAVKAREEELLAEQDTERNEARTFPSGARPKLGTVPILALAGLATAPMEPLLAALLAPSTGDHGERPEAPSPTQRIDEDRAKRRADAAAEDDLRRKLEAIAVLREDDSLETREALSMVLVDADESPILRANAAAALGVVGDEAAVEALRGAASTDRDPLVRRAAEGAAFELSFRLGLHAPPLEAMPELHAPEEGSSGAPFVAPANPRRQRRSGCRGRPSRRGRWSHLRRSRQKGRLFRLRRHPSRHARPLRCCPRIGHFEGLPLWRSRR
ncbi:MAG: protein kinase [Polyangiaceae bacterium]